MFGLCPHIDNKYAKTPDLECGVEDCPDSVLNPIMMPGRPLLMKKMDAAPVERLATMTLKKVDMMTSKKVSAVTRTLAAKDAMKKMYRAAMGSPIKTMRPRILAMVETNETYEEDEDVGDTKLPPWRAAAAKLSPRAAADKPSPRRAAAAKLPAKGTKLLEMRQAARRLGLGYDCCSHDDCSPHMYGCPEMTAATENHERFTFTSPLPLMEVELSYECRHKDGDTEMYEIEMERFAYTQSPLPAAEDFMEDYKVFRTSSYITTLQPGPWNISSSVQCCQAALQLRLKFQRGAGISAAAYCCALQRVADSPQSTASQLPSGTPPPHLARCSQVCRKDGPVEAREAREQRHHQLQEGPRRRTRTMQQV